MNLPANERQGYLGNIKDKSVIELRELLTRQLTLIKKEKFLNSLPDKGKKVHDFAQYLQQLIAAKDEIENVTKGFENLSVYAREGRSNVVIESSVRDVKNVDHDNDDKESDNDNDRVIQEKSKQKETSSVDDSCNETNLTPLIVGDAGSLTCHSVNSYLKVMEKSTQPESRERNHFSTNSTLKVSCVSDLPEHYKHRAPSLHVQTVGKPRKHILDGDPSAAIAPQYQCEKAKLLSLHESFQLLQDQARQQELLQSRLATQRLTERLGVKMSTFNPEGAPYREYPQTQSDTDSDDEPEQDYPDT